MKKNKGITLIALIITIVVLLILAGVAISSLSGDEGGLLGQAQTSTDKYNDKVNSQQDSLTTMEDYLVKWETGVMPTHDTVVGFSGEGTVESPYLIESIEDLVQFSLDVENGNTFSGKVIKLAQDLDFKNAKSYIDSTRTDMYRNEEMDLKTEMTSGIGFFPIGFDDAPFSGTFDGQGFKILNLYQDQDTDDLGLFGHVVNGSVNNVNVTGIIKGEVSTEVESGSYGIGGIVGHMESNTNVQIENCSFTGNVEASYKVASVVGRIDTTANVTIKNCTATGNVTGLGQASGIVGAATGNQLTIENCNNKANVTITKDYRAAGIIAYAGVSAIDIKNCRNSGEITSTAANGHAFSGIVGSVNIETTTPTTIAITDCYNSGAITGEYELGGILGQVYCAANVDVTLRGNDNNGIITSINSPTKNGVGGIVGHIGTEETATIALVVDDCNNNAKIVGNNVTGIAGVIGSIWGETTIDSEIKNCNNSGVIEILESSTTTRVSGISGLISANSNVVTTIDNCVNTANIICKNATKVAGIIADISTDGTVSTTIKNCLNTGNIVTTLVDSNVDDEDNVGVVHAGIIGTTWTPLTQTVIIENSVNTGSIGNEGLVEVAGIFASSWPGNAAGSTLTINNCVNVGTITGNTDWGAGGIVGDIDTDMTENVTNTYYLADSYNAEDMLGTSKTVEEMKATGTGSVLEALNTEAQAHSSDTIPYLTWKQNSNSYPVINI